MSSKHPAVQAYEELWEKVVNCGDDVSLMPRGSGDPVGRIRIEAEWKRRGIKYPDNIVDEFHWWEQIGGLATAKRLTRKWKAKQKRAQEAQ